MRLNDEAGVEPEATEPVGEGIIRVPLVTLTLLPATRTNTYLIRGDSRLWIVDPGAVEGSELLRLELAVDQARADWDLELGGVIATHHHHDHVGGLPWFASRHQLPVLAERTTVDLLWDDLDTVAWEAVEGDGSVDGLELVHTPGHAPGHLAIWTADGGPGRAARVLLAGDLLAGIGTILINPPRGNMAHYVRSLEKAAALDPAIVLPAHGPGTASGRDRILAYRDHRLAREERVLAALSTTEWRQVDDVTARAYSDVGPWLSAMAGRVALAHLYKLVDDGTVEQSAAGFRARV